MSQRSGEFGSSSAWLALAGAAIAGAICGAWAKSRRRPAGAVGAHAWLVPLRQARAEAQWTRQALVHASESKHG